MRTTLMALTCLSILVPESASAQLVQEPRFGTPPITRPVDSLRLRRQASRFTVVSTRSFTSLLGMVVGGVGGFALGGYYTPVEKRDTYVASDGEIIGMLVGGLVGTAAGAALPSFGSTCPFSKRFWRGMGGATLGLVPAIAFGPLGPSVGAALAQGRC